MNETIAVDDNEVLSKTVCQSRVRLGLGIRICNQARRFRKRGQPVQGVFSIPETCACYHSVGADSCITTGIQTGFPGLLYVYQMVHKKTRLDRLRTLKQGGKIQDASKHKERFCSNFNFRNSTYLRCYARRLFLQTRAEVCSFADNVSVHKILSTVCNRRQAEETSERKHFDF